MGFRAEFRSRRSLLYFGGTTGHWAGFCAPFDPIDFETRDWVPDSGWPITRQDLDPFYERAQVLTEMGPYEYDAEYWQARDPELVPLKLGDNFWTKMWQFSPPTRFGTTYRDPILNAGNVTLYTYATLVELVTNPAVNTIDHLSIRTPDGRMHQVRAPVVVMACGAIQNARLLLASNRQAPRGIGNDNDLVGRYFMEHIEIPGANMVLARSRPLKMYVAPPRVAGAPTPARGELALSAATQRQQRILNGTAEVSPGRFEGQIVSTFQIRTPEVLRQRREERARGEALNIILPEIVPGQEFRLRTRQEQAPNPDSRVTLMDELDAMGLPRVRLAWRLTELDKISIRRYYELLGQALGETGQGRVQLTDWLLDGSDTSWPDFLSGGWHHMGTTRMHTSPTRGVVDAD